jgi:hypothetical protein
MNPHLADRMLAKCELLDKVVLGVERARVNDLGGLDHLGDLDGEVWQVGKGGLQFGSDTGP